MAMALVIALCGGTDLLPATSTIEVPTGLLAYCFFVWLMFATEKKSYRSTSPTSLLSPDFCRTGAGLGFSRHLSFVPVASAHQSRGFLSGPRVLSLFARCRDVFPGRGQHQSIRSGSLTCDPSI